MGDAPEIDNCLGTIPFDPWFISIQGKYPNNGISKLVCKVQSLHMT